MSNQLTIKEPKIFFITPGHVSYDFTELLLQAKKIRSTLKHTVVTEDTLQDNKKLIAELNKSMKELNDRRISIKKEILAPYEKFEKDIKDITEIIKETDTLIRTQVKEFDEHERSIKLDNIKYMFDDTLEANYPDLKGIVDVNDFVKPAHLNKGTSMKVIGFGIDEFLTKVQSDIDTIQHLENSEMILLEYYELLDLNGAIKTVNDNLETLERYEETIQDIDSLEVDNEQDDNIIELKEMKTIKVFVDDKELKALKHYLVNNDINFIVE